MSKRTIYVIGVIVVAIGSTAIVSTTTTQTADPTTTTVEAITTTQAAAATATTVAFLPPTSFTTTTTVYIPRPEDFEIDLIVIEKDCFGSAGCNVIVEPDLIQIDGPPLPDGSEWLVVYQVIGGEEGILVFNLTIDEVDAAGYSYLFRSELIQTTGIDVELSAGVVAVRARS